MALTKLTSVDKSVAKKLLSELPIQVSTVAEMKTKSYEVGQVVETVGYYAEGDAGAARYLIVAAQAADEYGDHTLANGTVAVLQEFKTLDLVYFGCTKESSDAVRNTTIIQSVFDNAPVGSKIIFSDLYPITSTLPFCLSLNRNMDLVGTTKREAGLRVDSASVGTSCLEINFDDNAGQLDVRNWLMENLTIFFNGDGKNCIEFTPSGFAILTSAIRNCGLSSGPDASSWAIRATSDTPSHCLFELNTISGTVGGEFGDANIFSKNTCFGFDVAFKFNLALGVYNNTVSDNTIVNRDGALHVVKGDEIRFTNNQCEQFLSYGQNQSVPSTMIRFGGGDRKIVNAVIRDNNLGGGTNVDYLMYFDTASSIDTVDIDNNKLVPTNIAEIYCSSRTDRIKFGLMNRQDSSTSNPRLDKMFRTKFVNLSLTNVNMPMNLSAYLQNGWVFTAPEKHAYRDEMGVLHFLSNVSGGTIVANDNILLFPAGATSINPLNTLQNKWVSGSSAHFSAGGSYAEIQFLGGGSKIRVKDFKSNSSTLLPSFQTNTNCTVKI